MRSRATERGLSALDEAVFVGPAGERKHIRMSGEDGGIRVRAIPLLRPPDGHFDVCPICLEPGPTSREHVPQGDLGGRVMTLTCTRCNNELGSRVEPSLLDYFDGAYTRFALEGDDVRGRRRLGRVLLRETGEGEPVWLMSTGPKLSSAVQKILKPGGAIMTYQQPPDLRRWKLAALKHAYLAACLCLQGLPDSPMSRATRQALVAVRDAPRHELPEMASAAAAHIRVQRTGLPANGVPISLDVLVDEDEEAVAIGLHLAGTLFVSWPLEDQLLHMVLEQAGIACAVSNGGLLLELPDSLVSAPSESAAASSDAVEQLPGCLSRRCGRRRRRANAACNQGAR